MSANNPTTAPEPPITAAMAERYTRDDEACISDIAPTERRHLTQTEQRVMDAAMAERSFLRRWVIRAAFSTHEERVDDADLDPAVRRGVEASPTSEVSVSQEIVEERGA